MKLRFFRYVHRRVEKLMAGYALCYIDGRWHPWNDYPGLPKFISDLEYWLRKKFRTQDKYQYKFSWFVGLAEELGGRPLL